MGIQYLPSSISLSKYKKSSTNTQLGPTKEAAAKKESEQIAKSIAKQTTSGMLLTGAVQSAAARSKSSRISGPTKQAAEIQETARIQQTTTKVSRPTVISNVNLSEQQKRAIKLTSGIKKSKTLVSNVRGKVEETLGGGGAFSKPFLSYQGQKERIGAGGLAIIAATTGQKEKIAVRKGATPKILKRPIEIAARNPYITAFGGAVLFSTSAATAAASEGLITLKAGETAIRSTIFKASPAIVQKGVTKVASSSIGRFGLELLYQGAKTEAIISGVSGFGKLKAPKEEKKLLETKSFKQSIIAAQEAEKKALGIRKSDKVFGQIYETEGGNKKVNLVPSFVRNFNLRALAYELPGGRIFSDKKGVYEQSIKDYAKTTGINPALAVSAAKRQRKYSDLGEFASLLELSRSAERIGREGISQAFSKGSITVAKDKSFQAIFKKTAIPLAKAGFIEGAIGEYGQERARLEKINIPKIGLIGGFGSISAVGIGGTIAGLAPTKPKTSGFIEGLANIADPLEKPGDILQNLAEKAAIRLGRKVPIAPVITFAPTETLTIGQPSKKTTPILTIGESIVGTKTPTTTKTDINAFVPTPSENIIFIDKKKPNIPTKPIEPNINIPINQPIYTPTDSIINNFVNQPTQVPTQIPTQIPTNILTTINIPTVTPRLRVPPPIPIQLPTMGSGFGGSSIRLRKKFVNELQAGLSLFGTTKPKKEVKKTKTKSKKSKSKKQPKQNNFNDYILKDIPFRIF